MRSQSDERMLDETILLVGLALFDELLLLSKYPPEIQVELKTRIQEIQSRYQKSGHFF